MFWTRKAPAAAAPAPVLLHDHPKPKEPELSDYAKHVVKVLDGCQTHDDIKDVVDQLIKELRVHYEQHLGTARGAFKYRKWSMFSGLGAMLARRNTPTLETHEGLKAMTEGVRAAYDYLAKEATVQAKLATREGHEDKTAQQEWSLLKTQKVRLSIALDAAKRVDIDMGTGDYAKVRRLALDVKPDGTPANLWDAWDGKKPAATATQGGTLTLVGLNIQPLQSIGEEAPAKPAQPA